MALALQQVFELKVVDSKNAMRNVRKQSIVPSIELEHNKASRVKLTNFQNHWQL